MDPLAYDVASYDRTRHEAFVRRSWVRGARQSWAVLQARFRRPDVRCLVAHAPGRPETLYGWAAVDDRLRAVIFAYSRGWPTRIRRRGLMRSLLQRLGYELTRPLRCLYWTPYATALADGGHHLVYAPEPSKRAAAAA